MRRELNRREQELNEAREAVRVFQAHAICFANKLKKLGHDPEALIEPLAWLSGEEAIHVAAGMEGAP